MTYDEVIRDFMDSLSTRAHQRHTILRELALYDWLANGDAMSGHSRRVLANEPSDPSTTPDRNPSPTRGATTKQALPGSDMSGQALPPTSDNTIYVTYAQDDVTPVLTRTSDA